MAGYAFWFDPSTIPGHYGDWARDLVFRARVLQRSDESMRVHIGDLLYYRIPEDKIPPGEIESRLASSNIRPGLLKLPIDGALWKHRIYAMAVTGISEATALRLHERLQSEAPYMGCYGFDPSIGLHRWLFEFTLILRYRIAGDECWTDYDEEVREIMRLGCFSRVRHVPVFDTDFVDPDDWEAHVRENGSDELHSIGFD